MGHERRRKRALKMLPPSKATSMKKGKKEWDLKRTLWMSQASVCDFLPSKLHLVILGKDCEECDGFTDTMLVM